MEKQLREYTILDNVTPVAVTSSTDATPIVVTATAHGLTTGDLVLIQGHTTNVAANGIFKAVVLTSSTFQLTDRYTGASVAGSGAGAGASGFLMKAPRVILIEDFKSAIISVFTTGTSTMTIKVAGSIGRLENSVANMNANEPNMGATIATANPYQFVQIVNLDTGTALNGVTGIVLTGADTQTLYEVNINLLKYFSVFPVTWTQGAITVKAILGTNL